jgi:hypothetical protein
MRGSAIDCSNISRQGRREGVKGVTVSRSPDLKMGPKITKTNGLFKLYRGEPTSWNGARQHWFHGARPGSRRPCFKEKLSKVINNYKILRLEFRNSKNKRSHKVSPNSKPKIKKSQKKEHKQTRKRSSNLNFRIFAVKIPRKISIKN